MAVRLHNVQDAQSFGKMLLSAAQNLDILRVLLRGCHRTKAEARAHISQLCYDAGKDITRSYVFYGDGRHDAPEGKQPARKWGEEISRLHQAVFTAVDAFVNRGRVGALKRVIADARALGAAFLGPKGRT